MSKEAAELEQLKKEEFLYDDEKLNLFLEKNADKYPKQKVSLTSILFQFVKQLKIGADITRISMPTYILKPISHLEVAADYSCFPPELLHSDKAKDPLERILIVLKWLLLRCNYVPQKGFENSKPYNPILGEVFECTFEHYSPDNMSAPASKTSVHIEQVSHHPPISSLLTFNEKQKILYESTMRISSTFRASGAWTYLQGYHCLTLLAYGWEQYIITFPAIVAKPGVLSSSIEYGDFLVVKCEKTGYEARLEATKNNEYVGNIKKDNKSVLKLSGNWQEYCLVEREDGMPAKFSSALSPTTIPQLPNTPTTSDGSVSPRSAAVFSGKAQVLLDVKKALVEEGKLTKKIVKPVYMQADNEGRRVWHSVTKYLKLNMLEEAQTNKFAIEDHQRYIRKEREEKGQHWTPKFHKQVNAVSSDGVPIFKSITYPAPLEALVEDKSKLYGINQGEATASDEFLLKQNMTQEEVSETLDLL